ncbi:MAG: hypothetical protein GAK30_02778 [Paracidovorax wautersii]|uniref:Tetratricopeptide repeat protein 38 n=1 Tax=Paracidovorax wautersii TaxID=1177982 RepID=A0A7V8FMA1_9BURK|nr:MAG: hypothetical protein GAK30_02778 [Paracidovorax wautersii]
MTVPHQDPLGNALQLEQHASGGAVDDFVAGFIGCDLRVLGILQAQHDASALVQAYLAMFQLFAESPAGAVNAQPYLTRAQAAHDGANPRTQLFVQAVSAWARGDLAGAVGLHERIAQAFPRDLVSLKLGQYHAFNLGDGPAMLRLARPGLQAAADVPQFHGMAAFAYEQCHLLDAAEHHARTAIALHRAEPWAHHALAHVLLTRGQLQSGTAFLEEMSESWQGLNSFMRTHNWWHLALFYIELDRLDEALALYDREVWGVDKRYTQDQVNAVSLLARLELAGLDVGERWQDVADHLEARTADQTLPFLDMQYLYGLARAQRPSAYALLQAVEARASASEARRDQAVWRDIALPACRGLLAHAQGHWNEAVVHLGLALPRLQEIGGSHAQRELFEQIHRDALQRSGHLAAVQNLLQPHLNSQPESRRLRRQARRLYASLGLPDTLAGSDGGAD